MRRFLPLFLLVPLALPLAAQPAEGDSVVVTEAHYRIYTGDGTPTTLDALVAAMGAADVVFLGEQHDDPVVHHLQRRLLERAHQQYGAERPVALSMEMFTREAQLVLDEYLADLITEDHFRRASNPWQNYETDYRPQVEYAKAHGLAVIGANAPRRYVNRVSRLGPDALADLAADAYRYLAPLPYAAASSGYRDKWDALMREAMAAMRQHSDEDDAEASDDAHAAADTTQPAAPMHGGPSYMLDAQSLWDATMAYSIAEHLMRAPNALVLHPVGAFHVEEHTGTPEHLLRYRPGTRVLVVTTRPVDDPSAFSPRFQRLADFVIQSDASLPRTYSVSF